MTGKQALLRRLEDIGRSLEKSEDAIALIGLGSVGIEIDEWMNFQI